jgi:sarcosine oxidase subunit beta
MLRVVVVGGGVIGASTAYHLARAGAAVTLLERGDLASGASGSCDKAVILQSKSPGIHLELALKSADLFGGLTADLGTDIEYACKGGMIVVEHHDQLPVMDDFVARQRAAGLDVHLIDGQEARKVQPILAKHVVAATWCRLDAEVNPMLLTHAFARRARGLGACVMTGTEVTGLLTLGGRVAGAMTPRGTVTADAVVLAAGAWTPFLAAHLGLVVPIEPRRGQILVSEPVEPAVQGDMLCATYIAAKYSLGLSASHDAPSVGLSLGQTRNGNLLLGGCREFAGYDRRTTHKALTAIARHACRIVPAIKGVQFIRSFAGLRPFTPDGLPILGPAPGIPGLFIASGHEGDGIALSPITGLLMAELLTEREPRVSLDGLGLDRFMTSAEVRDAEGDPAETISRENAASGVHSSSRREDGA